MKKLVGLLLLHILFLNLASCGGSSSESTAETPVVLAYSSSELGPLRSDINESKSEASNYYFFFHYYYEDIVEKLEANDTIIRKLQMHLTAKGQSFQVEKKRYEENGEIGEYLVLKLYNKSRSDNTRTRLNRLAKKVGVNAVYLDLVSTAAGHFAGYFSPNSNELNVAAEYIDSLFIHNDIGTTARHELAHAMFENMRKEGVESVYHSSFTSRDNSDLVDFETGYAKFISAEELYTFVSNMYWATKADLDVLIEDGLPEVLETVEREINSLLTISRQVYELSDEVQYYLGYSFPGMRYGEDLYRDDKKADMFHLFYGNKSIKSYSKKITVIAAASNSFVNLANKAIREGNYITELNPNQFPSRYRKRANSLYNLIVSTEKEIVSELKSEMIILNRVSNFFISETEKLEAKFKEIRAKIESGDDEVSREQFTLLRKELRTFINKSREWHPTFAGLLD